jgi:voltage-gated potassium channel
VTSTRARIGVSLGALLLIVVVGSTGYVVIEGWPPFDALYMTVTTIAAVGYAEVHPLSTAGRVWTLFVIVLGVGGAAYTFTAVVQLVFEGSWNRDWESRRMLDKVNRLYDHFIVCGFGRVGRQVAMDFQRSKSPFVIVDSDEQTLGEAAKLGCLCVAGDASDDQTLRAAGVERARGLVACVRSDADNIFVVLSARAISSRLFIVARCNDDGSAPKLARAGADRVVSPYNIGGRQMAMLATRPAAVEFVETVLHGGDQDLLLEEIAVGHSSSLAGCSVGDAQTRVAPGVQIVALRRQGRLIAQPRGDESLQAGDLLVAMGTAPQLRGLETAAG